MSDEATPPLPPLPQGTWGGERRSSAHPLSGPTGSRHADVMDTWKVLC